MKVIEDMLTANYNAVIKQNKELQQAYFRLEGEDRELKEKLKSFLNINERALNKVQDLEDRLSKIKDIADKLRTSKFYQSIDGVNADIDKILEIIGE